MRAEKGDIALMNMLICGRWYAITTWCSALTRNVSIASSFRSDAFTLLEQYPISELSSRIWRYASRRVYGQVRHIPASQLNLDATKVTSSNLIYVAYSMRILSHPSPYSLFSWKIIMGICRYLYIYGVRSYEAATHKSYKICWKKKGDLLCNDPLFH